MMQYVSSSDDEDDIGLPSLNISNDQYYRTRIKLKFRRQLQENHDERSSIFNSAFSLPVYGSKTICHSIPAYDLWKAFFPTYLDHDKFKNFHRPRLRHYNSGPQSRKGRRVVESPIKNLTAHIFKSYKQLRTKVTRALENNVPHSDILNHLLRIKQAKDLTAKNGELFLFEYCEEYPPVLSQVGMSSNIKNYVAPGPKARLNMPPNKRGDDNSSAKPDCNGADIGSLTCSKSPSDQIRSLGYPEETAKESSGSAIYFSPMRPGMKMQVIENNLYRAPIFKHDMPDCDFLIIRTRNSLYVRSIKTIFTVGQTMPLVQVNPPTDRHIMRFRCDLSNLYIHKLFAASDTEPPSLHLENLVKLFPDYPASILRKRLISNGADFGVLSDGERVIQQGVSNYGELPWSERYKIITPEQYCSYMATLAARERLRNLNYTESMINPESVETELEPEILAAPWNTTKAIQNLLKNRSFLDLRRHQIDPTGAQREGFSCISWSRSPTEEQQAKEARDYRKRANQQQAAPLVFGKNPLRHKITQEKLKRMAEYRKEAQLIIETQAKILSCDEIVTSSEDEDGEIGDEEEDCENDAAFKQQVSDLDRLITGGQTINGLNFEKEEEERRQLLMDLQLGGFQNGARTGAKVSPLASATGNIDLAPYKGKVLKITRTYENDGVKSQRCEIVTEPKVIALYDSKYRLERRAHLDGTKSGAACGGDEPVSYRLDNGSDLHNMSLVDFDKTSSSEQRRARSASLGPSELCRAEGTRIRISKKVLDHVRPFRGCRRESAAG